MHDLGPGKYFPWRKRRLKQMSPRARQALVIHDRKISRTRALTDIVNIRSAAQSPLNSWQPEARQIDPISIGEITRKANALVKQCPCSRDGRIIVYTIRYSWGAMLPSKEELLRRHYCSRRRSCVKGLTLEYSKNSRSSVACWGTNISEVDPTT